MIKYDEAFIAKVAHEAVRAYSASQSEYRNPHWDAAGEEAQASATAGVKALLAAPSTTPSQNHENWMGARLRAGWKWGPAFNRSLKTHPDLVPFNSLSPFAKAKDFIFQAVTAAMADGLLDESNVAPASEAPEDGGHSA
jgi:hypothetical protein